MTNEVSESERFAPNAIISPENNLYGVPLFVILIVIEKVVPAGI
jgi:hypothetical protein